MKIFLIDDHEAIRNGVKVLLETRPEYKIVGESENIDSIFSKVEQTRPDVILIDISMSGGNIFELVAEVKKFFPSILVVFLTAHEDPTYLQEFAKSGASGYVLKRSAANEIIKCLETLQRGDTFVDPAVSSQIFKQLREREKLNAQEAILNEHEKHILAMIARGLANKEIARSLNLSVRTIESYKARAMTKLGFKGRNEIVRFAYKHGWLQDNDENL